MLPCTWGRGMAVEEKERENMKVDCSRQAQCSNCDTVVSSVEFVSAHESNRLPIAIALLSMYPYIPSLFRDTVAICAHYKVRTMESLLVTKHSIWTGPVCTVSGNG